MPAFLFANGSLQIFVWQTYPNIELLPETGYLWRGSLAFPPAAASIAGMCSWNEIYPQFHLAEFYIDLLLRDLKLCNFRLCIFREKIQSAFL